MGFDNLCIIIHGKDAPKYKTYQGLPGTDCDENNFSNDTVRYAVITLLSVFLLQTDYYNLIDVAANLVETLESYIQGNSVRSIALDLLD